MMLLLLLDGMCTQALVQLDGAGDEEGYGPLPSVRSRT